jgi:predicted exporter
MNHKTLKKRLTAIKTNFLESSDSIFLAFEGINKNELLEKSMAASQIIEKKNPDLSFLSPAIFLPSETTVKKRKQFIKNNFNKKAFLEVLRKTDFTEDCFDNWLNKINNITDEKLTGLPDFINDEINSMFIKWNSKEYLLIPLYDRDRGSKIKKVLTKNNTDFFIIDIMKDTSDGLVKFEKNALFLLLLSIVIIFLILLIAYKNIIHAFTSILPCISALTACIAVTVITGRNYNIMHFVSSILLLGIGVDYGIFITGAFRDNYSQVEIKSTFQSIFISALTTLAGFGVLILSRNYSVFSLGSTMFTGIVTAFLTSYMALPFILKKN